MPSFSRNLQETLHRAAAYANQRKHEYATLEHLLLALTDDEDAGAVMRACSVDLAALKKSLVNYLDTELRSLIVEDGEDAKPTAGFNRVLQRALIHVQSSGRDEVTGANVLVAVFSERESHAAFFLQEQDMTRYDAVNFIAHGIAKKAGASEPRAVKGATEEGEDKPNAKTGGEALEAYCVNLNEKAKQGKVDPLIGRHAEVAQGGEVLGRTGLAPDPQAVLDRVGCEIRHHGGDDTIQLDSARGFTDDSRGRRRGLRRCGSEGLTGGPRWL